MTAATGKTWKITKTEKTGKIEKSERMEKIEKTGKTKTGRTRNMPLHNKKDREGQEQDGWTEQQEPPEDRTERNGNVDFGHLPLHVVFGDE